MAFRTKLDFSSNRQVKQHEKTITALSGGTSFGLPYGSMTSGPDLNTSAITQTISSLLGNTSTFSGNGTTTNFTWFDSRMDLGSSSLSAITPSNSATTQNTGIIFTSDTTTIIDNNLVNLTYSGVSFDASPLTMVSLGGGDYSGTVVTYTLDILSASTLDFTGRTIWNDVSGITRTERLIITDNPTVGYVWTCIDSEGMGEWQYNGTGSTSTIWTAGTGANSAVLGGSNGIASGTTSVSEGYGTIAGGNYSHAGGYNTITSGLNSFVHGENSKADNNNTIVFGKDITGTSANTVYVPSLIINTGGTGSMLGINTSSPQYVIDAKGNNARLVLADTYTGDDLPFKSFVFSANSTNVPQIVAATNNYTGGLGLGLAMGVVGNNSISTATSELVGTSGDTYINSTQQTNNLNILNRSGGSGTNHIRMYAGVDGVSAAAEPDFFIQGNGTTDRGYIGIYTATPSEKLDVNGNARFRSIGSSASSGALHYTANGTLTTNTSDERLKTNITTLTGALVKVNQLRGVSYNWKENPTGDTRIGFVAQEVNSVVPELTFTNPNSSESYMGVHYDNVTALLVEAVKELTTGITTSNNTHLETQTILAEDNNIDLNYSGTPESAIGGGIRVLHALGVDSSAELITDSEGNFITNNNFKPNSLTIPFYKPNSSEDINGNIGNITRDDEYLYIKCQDGWRRSSLERF
jgi:hypothetical protein